MISIKAISAIALGGLGAATMGTDVYLATQKPEPPPPLLVMEAPPPARPQPVTVREPVPPPPVEIAPVVIYGRRAARPAPKQELVACSDWHSLASGPAGRGVRTLCMRDVQQ